MRICSLLPSATEILFALGFDDEVVAVTHQCDYPAEARAKPKITTRVVDPAIMSSHDIDRLILQPHLFGSRPPTDAVLPLPRWPWMAPSLQHPYNPA